MLNINSISDFYTALNECKKEAKKASNEIEENIILDKIEELSNITWKVFFGKARAEEKATMACNNAIVEIINKKPVVDSDF